MNIISQLLLINFLFFTFLIISLGNGIFFLKKLNLYRYFKANIFSVMLFGLIFTGFFAQFLNFFFPLNNFLIYINFIFSLYVIYKNRKFIYFYNLKKTNFIYIIILFFILAQIYASNFSDDLSHYHLPSIINSDERNYIIGSNFLHNLYGTSSIWLTLNSFFNFDQYRLQSIHVLNGLLFFYLLSYLLLEYKKDQYLNNELKIWRVFIIFFLLLKYTRIKEFGIDRAAFIVIIFFLDIFFKNFKNLFFLSNKNISKDLIILFSILSIFIFFIKIIFFPVLLFFILLILLIKKKINFNLFFDGRISFVFFIFFVYLIKNLLISGCLIYPINFLCIKNLSWYSYEITNNFLINTEIINKSFNSYNGTLEAKEFVKNLNWLKTWITRTKHEFFDFAGIITISLILSLACFSFHKKNNYYKKNYTIFIILLPTFIFSFYIWFFYTPLIRMGHHIFIIFIILILFFLSFFFYLKERKIITIFLTIIIFSVNLSKNFIRIANNEFVNNPEELIIKDNYKASEEKLDTFTYSVGWLGKAPLGHKLDSDIKYKKIFIYDVLYKIK